MVNLALKCLVLCVLLIHALQAADAEKKTDAAEILTLREHQDFVNTFTVTNPYERAIRVQKTDTSCTCLEFNLGKKFLLPGESTTLDVRVGNERSSGLRKYKVWLYVSDPELEPIEIVTQWKVSPDIAVDLIERDPSKRPDNKKYRDIYRYISNVRPDEAKRLKKYIRLSTPDTLEGGLQISPSYNGKIWDVSTKKLDDQAVLLIAKAKDPDSPLEEGLFQEVIEVSTNHPKKKQVSLQFFSNVDKKAGTQEQRATGFDGPQKK